MPERRLSEDGQEHQACHTQAQQETAENAPPHVGPAGNSCGHEQLVGTALQVASDAVHVEERQEHPQVYTWSFGKSIVEPPVVCVGKPEGAWPMSGWDRDRFRPSDEQF